MKVPAGAAPSAFLERFSRSFAGFAAEGGLSALLQRDARLVRTGGGTTVVHVSALPHLAVAGVPMTKAVLLALLDDFNALHSAVDDAQRRPGVSLTMDIAFHPRLEEVVLKDEDLRIESRTVRSGLNVAVSHMEAERASTGQLLASGTHVKFMRMPFPWEPLMQPWLQPLVLAMGDAVVKPLLQSRSKPRVKAESAEECFTYDSQGHPPPSVVPTGAFANPMGAVHGGAMAGVCIAAAEWAAGSRQLSSLQVRFCGAGNATGGRLQSQVEELPLHGREEDRGRCKEKRYRGSVTQGERERLCLTFDATVLPS